MTRAEELVKTFVKANDADIKTVEALTDEQWLLKTAAKGWPVSVVGRHIVARAGIDELERILSGYPTRFWTDMNELDAANARDARDFADCTKEEVLDLLRGLSSRIERLVGTLTVEQLKARGEVLGRGLVIAEQWVAIMMLNHVVAHHESIIQTVSPHSAG
jgi:hypothetical protein